MDFFLSFKLLFSYNDRASVLYETTITINIPLFSYHTENSMTKSGEEMKARIARHKKELIFLGIYTLVFLLLSQLALYLTPLLIALVIAIVMKPLYDYFRRRFNFRSTFAATVIALLIFGVVFAVIGFLLYLVFRQAVSLFDSYGYLFDGMLATENLPEQIRRVLLSGDLMGAVTDVAATLFQLIPLIIIFVVITFALTVWLLHHMSDLKARLLERAGDDRRETLSRVFTVGYALIRRFIRSYLILYLITFVEAAFIFYLTGVEYPLPFALITAVADILPILGPGIVFIPFGIVFILQGNYFSGIIILIYFILTGVLRQIMEPKIVSDSVKIHPLIVMAGVYLSVASMNLWVLFYVLILSLLYKVLLISGVFESRQTAKCE